MPTGTGKTETMLSIFVSKRCPKLLIIVPTDALRTQIAEKFLTLGLLKRYRVAASGCLYPVVGILKHRMKTVKDVDYFFERCNVVVSTIQIAGQCKPEVQARMAEHCPYQFIDEAHHIAAQTWRDFKGRFASRRVLQFMATPFREDDKPVDGKMIFRYPLAKAQEEGYFRPVHFKPVREFDPHKADHVIAARAVAQLRKDRKRFNHILMARVDSIKRAEEVFKIYEKHYPDLDPVRIHTGVAAEAKRKNRQKIISGESKIVVCVNMPPGSSRAPRFSARSGRAGVASPCAAYISITARPNPQTRGGSRRSSVSANFWLRETPGVRRTITASLK